MSWDSYISNLSGQCKGALEKACIIGLDGSKWTTDAHAQSLKVSLPEAKTLGDIMKKKEFGPFQASGIVVVGIKYQYLREMDGTIVLGKKKDHGAITLQSSKTAVVIGITKEGGQQGDVNKGIAVIAEYLESLGM